MTISEARRLRIGDRVFNGGAAVDGDYQREAVVEKIFDSGVAVTLSCGWKFFYRFDSEEITRWELLGSTEELRTDDVRLRRSRVEITERNFIVTKVCA